jgi:hypothetical protein
VYYGDEVGVTGSDDPDNRRTYPWAQEGGKPDTALQAHYGALGALRAATPVLRDGALVALQSDDANGTLAYGRKSGTQAAIIAIDKGSVGQTVSIPTAGFVADGTVFRAAYGVGNDSGGTFTATGGAVHVPLAALSALVLVTDQIDLTPPSAPVLSLAQDGNGTASVSWAAVDGAASYDVYRSPVTGGGYTKVGTTAGTRFDDTGLTNGVPAYYVVRALDAAGNQSDPSNEVKALPHLVIGWADLQWPPSGSFTLSTSGGLTAYGQVWIDGVTSQPGPTPSLDAQLGYGPAGTTPTSWTWSEAAFNTDVGNNDEFVASINPQQAGSYDYGYRFSTTGGRDWTYGASIGHLTVNPSGDTTPAAVPTGLHVTAFGPASISLGWDAVGGDAYGYEVLRSSGGSAYSVLALVTDTSYTDATVAQGQTYSYVVRSVDTSWNRSANSAPVSQVADVRQMSVTFTVTVPATTDATGRSVHIAGTLDRLDGGNPQWDPGATPMTRVDPTHWTITFTGKEGTQLEYKYTLGDWDHVEKGPAPGCAELSNRTLTLTYGSGGTQAVNDTVDAWVNVAPC